MVSTCHCKKFCFTLAFSWSVRCIRMKRAVRVDKAKHTRLTHLHTVAFDTTGTVSPTTTRNEPHARILRAIKICRSGGKQLFRILENSIESDIKPKRRRMLPWRNINLSNFWGRLFERGLTLNPGLNRLTRG